MFGSLPEIAEFSVGTDSAVRILPEFDKFSQSPEHNYDPSTKGPHRGLVLKSMTLPYAVCLQLAAASGLALRANLSDLSAPIATMAFVVNQGALKTAHLFPARSAEILASTKNTLHT